MKINGVNRPQIDVASTARAVPKSGGTGAGTKVAVSGEARTLAAAKSPAVSDAAKVAKLMSAIARGDFMVDAERVTDRMMTEER
ncbi:MAG: hypothetical protein JWN48_1356 [Myxococcaceae bacterium]|nr:hypothetical protein [Myxococcaceae bacterium]